MNEYTITSGTPLEIELSESRTLRTIIETEPECVKLLNADGTLILMNRAGLDMIQVDSLDQVKGQSVNTLVLPEYREAFRKLTKDVFQGKAGNLTFEMMGVKGRRLWLDTHAVPLRNERDEIIALLAITRDVTERKMTEDVLKKERDFTAAVLNTVGSMVLVLDRDGKIIRFNRTCEKVSGYAFEDVRGRHVWDLLIPPEQVEGVKNVFRSLTSGMFPSRYENYWVAKDGRRKLIAWSNTALLAPDGSVEYVIPTGIDITEHRRLEDQLRQSQKMESIGTLAGGISHDFNNILTAIIGYGSILRMKMKSDDPLLHNVEQILASADRAATLTQGLLAYSRKQVLNPQPMNLNEIIRKVERLLMRLIGEDIELKMILSDKEMTVLVDACQVEQVLMNLATNARDAMPDGGYLFIETERALLDDMSAKAYDLAKPGTYAVISVTDSGMGMDEKTRERIFEPFFTTKEAGKGTGLGLATVYGIVKQHNGTIEVESEIGKGSTFRIYLPAQQAAARAMPPIELPPIKGGTETVLVAEDDEAVRKLVASMLEQFGYTVIQATNGEDAVNKFMMNRGKVQLLLLDVIMPKKSGKEVLEKIRIFSPDIKALFLSGYTADIVSQKGLLDKGWNFILKPVQMSDLLRQVRTIFDGK
jgi:two-component system cell cycle sensor histidine kinase/response regulator CckA